MENQVAESSLDLELRNSIKIKNNKSNHSNSTLSHLNYKVCVKTPQNSWKHLKSPKITSKHLKTAEKRWKRPKLLWKDLKPPISTKYRPNHGNRIDDPGRENLKTKQQQQIIYFIAVFITVCQYKSFVRISTYRILIPLYVSQPPAAWENQCVLSGAQWDKSEKPKTRNIKCHQQVGIKRLKNIEMNLSSFFSKMTSK